LVTPSDGHNTVMLAEACSEAALPALAVAWLVYVPQVEDDVAPLTPTVTTAFPARLPKLQLSVCPEIEHVPGPLYAGLMLQAGPEGRVSLRVAVVTVAEPAFVTTMVKPIAAPATTGAVEPGVSDSTSPLHCTFTLADACTDPLLPALAVAVFRYVPQLGSEVALET
jgi:hypothetical protein